MPEIATEWLETDGLGGFASGTVDGPRTRRYHGLLVTATTPPTGRMMLVNGLDAEVLTAAGRFALTRQRYAPGIDHPGAALPPASFTTEPWPTWRWTLPGGATIVHELFMPYRVPALVLRWRCEPEGRDVVLGVRPYLSGRDYHGLHHENPAFHGAPERRGDRLVWHPYAGVPAVHLWTSGAFRADHQWYRRFAYDEERARGFPGEEDLVAPGALEFDLGAGDAVAIVSARALPDAEGRSARDVAERLRRGELDRRRGFASPMHRAADQYLVARGSGRSLVAGYPWFTDWGRDTFIAMRGLCLALGRLDEARSILLTWADAISEGMVPNRFPDAGEAPEYNAVDASLWYVIVAHEFLETADRDGFPLSAIERARLREAILEIVGGYARGTRYGIRGDDDGLLAAGEPGQQLTWMDARVGDREITPRIGKPVEVQALWLNALRSAGGLDARWRRLHDRGRKSFRVRFWNPDRSCLYDVIDVDHVLGATDPSLRPNQVLALGGLPAPSLDGARARRALATVEAELWTPLGLRTLAPGEPGYRPRYEGGPAERDGAYHQGTVWPWLIGPFVDAWVRTRRSTPAARREARGRFLTPLLDHLEVAGLGHVSEIADAEAPHAPRGCPFQAWSLGELIRALAVVDDAPRPRPVPPAPRSRELVR